MEWMLAQMTEFSEGDAQALGGALGGVMILAQLLFTLVIYCYFSFAVMTIAKKVGHENPWWAWVPILNIYQMTQIAKKEWWWLLLCFIPCVNIVIIVILWMGLAKARNKPEWWGILVVVPCANLVVPGYLAWSE